MNTPCTFSSTACDMVSASAPGHVSSNRSGFVTAVGWLAIVAGGLGSVISVISFLMLLARSYGTNTGGPLDWLLVLAGPPMTVLAGIGLLRRKRWAWFCIVGILLSLLGWQAYQIAFPPASETTTYISPSGVRTTVIGSSGPAHSIPVIAGGLAMLAVLLSRRARAEFAMNAGKLSVPPPLPRRAELECEWRVGHTGRDMMYYEELRDGAWQRISIDGEMLMGRAHHVIYFASPERWQQYPEWARHRRDEIISRVKSEFREPDYEFSDGGGTGVAEAWPVMHGSSSSNPMSASQCTALLAALMLLLGIAGLMGWLVQSGLKTNETWWPAKRSSYSRVVARDSEPAMFWTAIGVYAAVGFGAIGLAAGMVCWSRDSRKA